MTHPFDSLTEESLRARPSVKWQHYAPEVLPCWVADMDFPPAPEIRTAIARFAESGDLGYPPKDGLHELRETVCARLAGRYGVEFEPDDVHALPGIVPGLYLAAQMMAGPGEGVIVQPPIYPPFMAAVENSGRELVYNPMRERDGGWEFDLEGLERAIGPSTRLLMLCNPQNPTGRVFRRDELEGLAAIVLKHRLWVVSDELHADLTFDGQHVPFAALGPEVAARTLTLYGPTKAFNIAGLKIGFAASHNRDLMARLRRLALGSVIPGNVLAQAATIAAYRDADEWLEGTMEYLRGNREVISSYLAQELPGVSCHMPQGTYLAWLDFRSRGLPGPAATFLLERALVGLNAGADFGPDDEPGSNPYDGFARLNFATSRPILERALLRIKDALAGLD